MHRLQRIYQNILLLFMSIRGLHRRTRINLGILLLFMSIWGLGTWGFIASHNDSWREPKAVFSAAYKALQMFGLNFDLEPRKKDALSAGKNEAPVVSSGGAPPLSPAPEEKVVELPLQFARFLAAGFSALSAILLISRPWRKGMEIALQIAWFWRKRVVIFGYGPLGQAIARKYSQTQTVTVVDMDPDGSRQLVADDDGVLFIEGDGSDPAVLRRVRAWRSSMIFVAYEDDLTSLDAATAIMRDRHFSRAPHWRSHRGVKVRMVSKSWSFVRDLTESQLPVSANLTQVQSFSVPEMVAIQLCESARFDRMALEAMQQRVHIVLVGCGALGEAILNEILLTSWRIGLLPPKITVIDRSTVALRSRIESAAPALFIPHENPGALPRLSAPILEFRELDLSGADISELTRLIDGQGSSITSYIVATGDDGLNLSVGLALERAMMREALEIAPIHVRLSNKYRRDVADITAGAIGLVSPFGSLESVVEGGRAFDDDPDNLPRTIHGLYVKAEEQVDELTDVQLSPRSEYREPAWDQLSPTLKAANRRLYRHAVQKIEDLGLQIKARHHGQLRVHGGMADEIRAAQKALQGQYGGIPDCRGTGPVILADNLKERIGQIAVVEHERWMTERALDGWRAAASPAKKDRDNARRLHNCMYRWGRVDQNTKQYDALLIWALTIAADEKIPPANEKKVGRVWLSLDRSQHREAWLVTREFSPSEQALTELDVGIGHSGIGCSDPAGCAESAARCFHDFVRASGFARGLARVRFSLSIPMDSLTYLVINAIAAKLSSMDIEVTASWTRRSYAGRKIAFAGHRDVSRVGNANDVERAIELALLALAFEHPGIELSCGFAPGGDQLFVKIWNRLGLSAPDIIMPYSVDLEKGRREYWSDEPNSLGAFSFRDGDDDQFGRVGVAKPEGDETAHQAQARAILMDASLVLVLWDGKKTEAEGGTYETVSRAGAMNIPVQPLNISSARLSIA